MEIYENILETLGNTPLVKLGRFPPGPGILARNGGALFRVHAVQAVTPGADR